MNFGDQLNKLSQKTSFSVERLSEMAFAAELADQYLVMERGEIIQRGRGKDMEAEGVRARMSI